MPLVLKLEAITGSSIEGVARDMVNAANRIGLPVQVEFNDATLAAWPGRGGPDRIVREYYRRINDPNPFICNAR